uniref:Uncharacterized protein n=1 Tax=Rhizophora mucronata TaxID=61149 RepID=A0A2P2QMY6_RHIMU
MLVNVQNDLLDRTFFFLSCHGHRKKCIWLHD